MLDMVAHWLRRHRSSWVQMVLWPPRGDLGQVLHLQLPVALRRVNSDTVSLLWSGALLKGSGCEKCYRSGSIQCDIAILNSCVDIGTIMEQLEDLNLPAIYLKFVLKM